MFLKQPGSPNGIDESLMCDVRSRAAPWLAAGGTATVACMRDAVGAARARGPLAMLAASAARPCCNSSLSRRSSCLSTSICALTETRDD